MAKNTPAEDVNATDPKDTYKLEDLASLLDSPLAQVKLWLTEANIQPLSPDAPEAYGYDAIERLRAHRTIV